MSKTDKEAINQAIKVKNLLKELTELQSRQKVLAESIDKIRKEATQLMIEEDISVAYYEFGTFTVSHQTRVDVDQQALKKLLEKLDLPLGSSFDRVWVFNQQKLLELVKDNKINEKQLKKITSVKKGEPFIRSSKTKKEDDLVDRVKKAQEED